MSTPAPKPKCKPAVPAHGSAPKPKTKGGNKAAASASGATAAMGGSALPAAAPPAATVNCMSGPLVAMPVPATTPAPVTAVSSGAAAPTAPATSPPSSSATVGGNGTMPTGPLPGAIPAAEALLARIPKHIHVMKYLPAKSARPSHASVCRMFQYSKLTTPAQGGAQHRCQHGIKCVEYRAYRNGIRRSIPFYDFVMGTDTLVPTHTVHYYDLNGLEPHLRYTDRDVPMWGVVSPRVSDEIEACYVIQADGTTLRDVVARPLSIVTPEGTVAFSGPEHYMTHKLQGLLSPVSAITDIPVIGQLFSPNTQVTAASRLCLDECYGNSKPDVADARPRRVCWVHPAIDDPISVGDYVIVPRFSNVQDGPQQPQCGSNSYIQINSGELRNKDDPDIMELSLPLCYDGTLTTRVGDACCKDPATDEVFEYTLRVVVDAIVRPALDSNTRFLTRHGTTYMMLLSTNKSGNYLQYLVGDKVLSEAKLRGASSNPTSFAVSRYVQDHVSRDRDVQQAFHDTIPAMVSVGSLATRIDAFERNAISGADTELLGRRRGVITLAYDKARARFGAMKTYAAQRFTDNPGKVAAVVGVGALATGAVIITHPVASASALAVVTVTAVCYAQYNDSVRHTRAVHEAEAVRRAMDDTTPTQFSLIATSMQGLEGPAEFDPERRHQLDLHRGLDMQSDARMFPLETPQRKNARRKHLRFLASLKSPNSYSTAHLPGCGFSHHPGARFSSGTCVVCKGIAHDHYSRLIAPVYDPSHTQPLLDGIPRPIENTPKPCAKLSEVNVFVLRVIKAMAAELQRCHEQDVPCPVTSSTIEEIRVLEDAYMQAASSAEVEQDYWVSLFPIYMPGVTERVFAGQDLSGFLRYIRPPGPCCEPQGDEPQPVLEALKLNTGLYLKYAKREDLEHLRDLMQLVVSIDPGADPNAASKIFAEKMKGHHKAAIYTADIKRMEAKGGYSFLDSSEMDRGSFVKREVKRGNPAKTTIGEMLASGAMPALLEDGANVAQVLDAIRVNCDMPRLIRTSKKTQYLPHLLHLYVDKILKSTLGFSGGAPIDITTKLEQRLPPSAYHRAISSNTDIPHRPITVTTRLRTAWASAGSPADWASLARHGLALNPGGKVAAVDFSSYDHSQSVDLRNGFYRLVRSILVEADAPQELLEAYDAYSANSMDTSFRASTTRRGRAALLALCLGQNMSGDRETGCSNTLLHHGVLTAGGRQFSRKLALAIQNMMAQNGLAIPLTSEELAFIDSGKLKYSSIPFDVLRGALQLSLDNTYFIDIIACIQGDDAMYFGKLVEYFCQECAEMATKAGIVSKVEMQSEEQLTFCGRNWMICRHPADTFSESFCLHPTINGPHSHCGCVFLDQVKYGDFVLVHPGCFCTQAVTANGGFPERVSDFKAAMRSEMRTLAVNVVPALRVVSVLTHYLDGTGRPLITRDEIMPKVNDHVQRFLEWCHAARFTEEDPEHACPQTLFTNNARLFYATHWDRVIDRNVAVYQNIYGADFTVSEQALVLWGSPERVKMSLTTASLISFAETVVGSVVPAISIKCAADEAWALIKRRRPVAAAAHVAFHTASCHFTITEILGSAAIHAAADWGTAAGFKRRTQWPIEKEYTWYPDVVRSPDVVAPIWMYGLCFGAWVGFRALSFVCPLPIGLLVKLFSVGVNMLEAWDAQAETGNMDVVPFSCHHAAANEPDLGDVDESWEQSEWTPAPLALAALLQETAPHAYDPDCWCPTCTSVGNDEGYWGRRPDAFDEEMGVEEEDAAWDDDERTWAAIEQHEEDRALRLERLLEDDADTWERRDEAEPVPLCACNDEDCELEHLRPANTTYLPLLGPDVENALEYHGTVSASFRGRTQPYVTLAPRRVSFVGVPERPALRLPRRHRKLLNRCGREYSRRFIEAGLPGQRGPVRCLRFDRQIFSTTRFFSVSEGKAPITQQHTALLPVKTVGPHLGRLTRPLPYGFLRILPEDICRHVISFIDEDVVYDAYTPVATLRTHDRMDSDFIDTFPMRVGQPVPSNTLEEIHAALTAELPHDYIAVTIVVAPTRCVMLADINTWIDLPNTEPTVFFSDVWAAYRVTTDGDLASCVPCSALSMCRYVTFVGPWTKMAILSRHIRAGRGRLDLARF